MQIPTFALADADVDAYLKAFQAALRGARLNTHYPDGRTLARMSQALQTSVHRGLYNGLELDRRTGIPTYKEWTRAQTDIALAAKQLAAMGDRAVLEQKALAHPGSAHGRNLARYDYYEEIRDIPVVALGNMDVAVRKVDRASQVAHFHVVLDKLDASGVFIRYSIDVSQRGAEAIATVDNRDVANSSEGFHALIYQFTSLDAEFTFVKLASMAGLTVERVIKGTIGPFFHPNMSVPDGLPVQNGIIATFGLDMAAVDIEDSRLNDPLAHAVDAQTRATYERLGDRLGYHVFKDRKFVCPHESMDDVRAFCEARGTRNVVYGV